MAYTTGVRAVTGCWWILARLWYEVVKRDAFIVAETPVHVLAGAAWRPHNTAGNEQRLTAQGF